MASRVNSRFVILLVVGIIGLLVLMLVAFNIAYKSAQDNMREGDRFLAAGDIEQAERAYSKAVYKDSTNIEYLDKWFETLSMIVPETETEYRDRFYTDYIGALTKKATVLRDDVDAHDRQLSLLHKQMKSGYSRGLADRLIEQTTKVLGFFTESPDGQVQPWERLRRYRGIAITQIAMRNGVQEESAIELGFEDLRRAIEADPDDLESRISLMALDLAVTNQQAPEENPRPRIEALQRNLERAEDYLAGRPDSMRMQLQRLLLNAELDRLTLDESLQPIEQMEQLKSRYASRVGELSRIAEHLEGDLSAQLDLPTLTLFASIENKVDPQGRYGRSRELLASLIERDPLNAELLYYAGKLANDANDPDEANSWFERIEELAIKPLSFEGFRQFAIQRQAMLMRAEIALSQAERIPAEERGEALARAKDLRDQYAGKVSDDDLSKVLLDGRLAMLNDRPDEALRLFKKFNEQTKRNNPIGLWYEAQVARQLGQNGVARDALEQMVAIDTSMRRIPAMLTLAQINEQLQDYESAAQYYEAVLELRPDMEQVRQEFDRINRLLNPELNDDPVLEAIYTSRRMRQGDSDTPSDYAGAVEYLRESVVRLDYDPRIARELASIMLDSGDIDGARALIRESVDRHPEDEGLASMLDALQEGDATQILVRLIRESDRPELEKLVAIAGIASSRGLADLFSETLEELRRIAPDDKRVIDFTFSDALRRGDIEQANELATRPGLTPVESLTLQARVAMAQGSKDRAVELLQQATATGTADASTFHLLAALYRERGRLNDAIDAYRQALAIRPDNADTIREYLLTLTQNQQYDSALSEARRLQRYGSGDTVFVNLWLTLESQFGGDEGRDFAVRQRERLLELNPNDKDNAYQLARLYMQAKRWDESRSIIERLRSGEDRIEYAELEAAWYADQGVVGGQDGLILANEVFRRYIESLPQPTGPEPYVINSRFMLSRGRPDLALEAANEAVAHQSPETMTGTRLLGDLYMRLNNFAKAAEAYQQVLDADADDENHSVRARLIDALVRLERYDEAQANYDLFPESMHTEMITMLQGAEIAVGRGDKARAQTILNNAVAAYPNDPLVYIKRAELMIGDETLADDMLSDLSRALELDPNSWQAYRIRSAGYFALGRHDDALNDLKATIRLNPNLDYAVFSALNELLSQPGGADEAVAVAREVIEKRPDDANFMSRIGGLFASRKEWEYASEFYGMAWEKRRAPSDGATYIDSLVRRSPPDTTRATEVINELAGIVGNINQSSGLLAANALVLQARGRDDFAQQQITKAFELSLESNAKLLNWGNNLSRFFEGRPAEEHIGYLETLKRRNSNPVIVKWLDFFIAQRLTREDPAPQRAYDMLVSLQTPDTPDPIALRAYRLHGTTLFAQKRYEEAAQAWRDGLERFSDDWEMNNNLAYVLSSKLGRPEEALAFGEKGIAQNSGRSEPYETMASIYIDLGKYDEARQMIETGSRFINSVPARVMMLLASGRLALKTGDPADARAKLTDARSVLRSTPQAYPDLEEDIDRFEQELNTGEN